MTQDPSVVAGILAMRCSPNRTHRNIEEVYSRPLELHPRCAHQPSSRAFLLAAPAARSANSRAVYGALLSFGPKPLVQDDHWHCKLHALMRAGHGNANSAEIFTHLDLKLRC